MEFPIHSNFADLGLSPSQRQMKALRRNIGVLFLWSVMLGGCVYYAIT